MSELWKKKSLIRAFAINDLKIRYRGSVLGFFWSLLEPLAMLTVLYFVFTHIFSSQIENFALYLLLGIIMWHFFRNATTIGMNSFISKRGIITKTYLPRFILPISGCITALLMLTLEFVVFVIFLIVLGFLPPITSLILPPIIMLEFTLALGIALILSVLNVRYRDFQHIWGVVTQAGFFATPIMYSLNNFPENVKQIILLNPMASIVEISHNAVLYNTLPSMLEILYPTVVSFGILIIGIFVFKHLESKVIEVL